MAEQRPDRTSDTTGAPAWLKVVGIVLLIAVVLSIVAVVMLAGGGAHTPRLH
jgi:hypothetical protein